MKKSAILLGAKDFSDAFKTVFSSKVSNRIDDYGITLFPTTKQERDNIIRRAVDVLLDPSIPIAGKHRIEEWEAGWKENLDKFKACQTKVSILPLYFGKHSFIRWRQEFYKVTDPLTEVHMLGALLDWLFDTYLTDASNIYEFGCGTGHNLLRARDFNAKAELWGLDWASSSQALLKLYVEKGLVTHLHGQQFDYFNPDYNLPIKPNSVVFTLASLEQTGSNYDPFISYLLDKNPKLCLHIEPMAEFLDPMNLIDFLSIQYFKKRGYLSGFFNRLKQLEKEGRITIHLAQRAYIGSMFVDGYSVVAWSPKAA